MQIELASFSCKGGRDYNEDSIRFLEHDGVCVVVVSDGLGAHGGGHIASSVTSDYLAAAFFENPRIDPDYVKQIFNDANTRVLNEQKPDQKMKSTGVALFIANSTAIWGHAGDSRLYYFYNKQLTKRTLDHSVSQMAVFSGEIKEDELRHHEDRNRVLRAFGGDKQIKAEVSPMLSFTSGFHAFLLCTDGFWEYVIENEMEHDLLKCNTPNEWLLKMVLRISKRAPDNNDNFSAAAAFIAVD
ncbi:MAG: protein phosphatase 2C domain-containing protein [Oscillospiraceae bacterium]|nr:protein phosphatase 2C domain-containing protein [Oscillospiraceae bacterium]